MPNLGLIALIALAGGFLSSPKAAAQSWEAINTKDAITDKVSKEACSTQEQYRLCFTFQDDGVWATVQSLGSDLFDTELFPAIRVDQNKAYESVTPTVIDTEQLTKMRLIPRSWEPNYVSWRAQVSSGSGKWTPTPPPLISEMVLGKELLVRVYLPGGFQKDLTYSLDGFCPAAAQVYAESAPPLVCP